MSRISNDMDESVNQKSDQRQYDPTLTDANVHLVGSSTTLCQVVEVLAYIRHALANNMKTSLTINIGDNVVNSSFMFDVNGMQIPDLVVKPTATIN